MKRSLPKFMIRQQVEIKNTKELIGSGTCMRNVTRVYVDLAGKINPTITKTTMFHAGHIDDIWATIGSDGECAWNYRVIPYAAPIGSTGAPIILPEKDLDAIDSFLRLMEQPNTKIQCKSLRELA